MVIGRATYRPGWKWSLDIGVHAGLRYCATEHVGMVVAGRAVAAMENGQIVEMNAGDLFFIAPGHDSWVVGDETYVSLHFMGAADYATERSDALIPAHRCYESQSTASAEAQPRREAMTTAKELLQAYIDGTAKQAAATLAEEGRTSVARLADLGVRPATRAKYHSRLFFILHEKMYPGFKFVDVKIYIDTPDQAFGEYTIHQKSGISGKDVHQRFFGHCVVSGGKIVLLREALNLLAAADGMFPNGIADIPRKK